MLEQDLQLPIFDDDHRALRQALVRWCEEELPAIAPDHEDVDADSRRLVRGLGTAGLLATAVPASAGGPRAQLDVRSLCLSRESLAFHDGLADFAFAMQGLGSGAISLFGTDAQREKYLPGVGRGELIAAFALSEPNAGSDVAAMSTRAEADGDSFVLSGTKTWISNGGISDFYTVFARTDGDRGSKGISCFVVDAATPGLEIAERIDVISPHPLATLRFDGCRVPASALVGERGRGFAVAMATLDVFRSTVGAAALGFARRAFHEALSHSRSREMFGGHLADLQLTQSTLGEMALEIDAASLLIYRAAWTKDHGAERVTREAAMAKLYATEQAQRIIDRALQLHGGLGVVSGHITERLYREIRALRIYEGASEVQKVIIGGLALRQH